MKLKFFQFGKHLIILPFIIQFFFNSCTNNIEQKKVKGVAVEIAPEKSMSFNNPSIFMGSSFGSFFQMLHKTGDYNEMLRYTSKKTKEKYSNEQLLAFYTNFQFSYPLKLKAKKEENDKIILLYQTTINATQKTIQFNVVIENDTCKVLLDNLDTSKPFIGM